MKTIDEYLQQRWAALIQAANDGQAIQDRLWADKEPLKDNSEDKSEATTSSTLRKFDLECYFMDLVDKQNAWHEERPWDVGSAATVIKSTWLDDDHWLCEVTDKLNSFTLAELVRMSVSDAWGDMLRLVSAISAEERDNIDLRDFMEQLRCFAQGVESVEYVLADRWGNPYPEGEVYRE